MPSQDSSDTPARRLIGGAYAFLTCAKLLHKADPTHLAWAPCFVQIAFALELGLKAFIREKGGSEKQQRTISHNLSHAYQAALEWGLEPVPPFQVTMINELSKYSELMELRYLNGDKVTELYSIPLYIEFTSKLISGIYKQCGYHRDNVAPR